MFSLLTFIIDFQEIRKHAQKRVSQGKNLLLLYLLVSSGRVAKSFAILIFYLYLCPMSLM